MTALVLSKSPLRIFDTLGSTFTRQPNPVKNAPRLSIPPPSSTQDPELIHRTHSGTHFTSSEKSPTKH